MQAPHAIIDFAAGPANLQPLRMAFGTPCRELFALSAAEVRTVLEEVDALARRGFWCVGYLRYEAACGFEPTAAVHESEGPLAYFSVHAHEVDFPDLSREPATAIDWVQPTSRGRFDCDMGAIQVAIAQGEVYQVNYTAALHAAYDGDPLDLFCALKRAQRHSHAAYLSNHEETVLSVSPELFFDWQGSLLQCRPMKGTAARGPTAAVDRANLEHLRTSAKERAENVMIVDLIRNDLSRVAQLGSVEVPRLFDCEPWPTVWQMTSSVIAQTRPGTRLVDVFQALFPCGSVTGAPKLRAMHWIRELEPHARGVYCGAVGVVLPGGAARFNVPIRTVTVRKGRAVCGIGSGITACSTSNGEWAEWVSKSQFLDQASRPFRLLQTIRIHDGRLCNLELHLDRLAAASAHFGFAFRRDAARGEMEETARASSEGRARVTVDVRGVVRVEISGMPQSPAAPLPVVLAPHAVIAPAAFLRHKTTRREHCEQYTADTPAVFDTLMWNERSELTEFTRGNVIFELTNGEQVTPTLDCGLLDGVGRACELAAGRVRERVVRVDELGAIRRIWFVNALRGLMPVRLTGVG